MKQMTMSWGALLSNRRLGRPYNRTRRAIGEMGRSDFLSDVDHITFSPSFRRLARKTQVFPLATNDHVHNRLTHSLEVSRVGRTLGVAVGEELFRRPKYRASCPPGRTPGDFGAIVEAACLAHDIGHPPFGHAGDRAIHHWFDHSATAQRLARVVSKSEFADLRNFDGNAQGFRRITQLDKNLFNGGLNLTFATLGAYVKYPRFSDAASAKTGIFLTEKKIMEEVSDLLGLIKVDNGFARHPLSFLVEAADDTCYGFLDLEDAVEVGALDLRDAAAMLLRALPAADRHHYRPRPGDRSHRVIFARMRGKVFQAAISSAVRTFLSCYQLILSGSLDRGLLDVAAETGKGPAKVLLQAKNLVRERVFPLDGKVSIELGGYAVLACLMDGFTGAALTFADAYQQAPSKPRIDTKSSILLEMLGEHSPRKRSPPAGASWTPYQCVRRVMDFVTGMTDEFAIRIARQISGQISLRSS